MSRERVKVGVIGCGNISGIYFKMMREVYGNILDVTACADLDESRARARAAENPGVRAVSVRELLEDPDIRIVVNLTVPKAHGEVALKAVSAGKCVYNEKPLTVDLSEARQLLAEADARGVLVGGAPDTFMGGGLQTCRKRLDDGAIGRPVAATAFMMCHGHESWHPDPEFYYEKGGGPVFDMGPYYLTALVAMLGPARRVCGSAGITFPTRTITSEKKRGKVIRVETPTHVTGAIEFVSGATATVVMSFDVWAHNHPCLEIYGTEGSMQLPDPNGFGGEVRIRKAGDAEWKSVPLTHTADINRGTGVADMALSLLRPGRPHRASGRLCFHVLEIMHALHESSEKGAHVRLRSSVDMPRPVPPGLPPGVLDD